MGPGYHPKYSRSGRMVAYGCGTDVDDSCRPHVGIRIRRADGRGRPRRITRGRHDNHPDWSPGGHRIVFTRYPELPTLLNPELWIYHRGHSRRLTEGERPAWSLKGEIAFVRDFNEIYVIRPDGSNLRRITRGFDPEWSPQGDKLVYEGRDGAIYTIRRDGQRKRRLTSSGHGPDFSPDGTKVVFSGGAEEQIVVMRSNGTRPRVLFQAAGDIVATEPDWQSLARR